MAHVQYNLYRIFAAIFRKRNEPCPVKRGLNASAGSIDPGLPAQSERADRCVCVCVGGGGGLHYF